MQNKIKKIAACIAVTLLASGAATVKYTHDVARNQERCAAQQCPPTEEVATRYFFNGIEHTTKSAYAAYK